MVHAVSAQDEDLEALRQQLAESQQTAEALRGSGVEARAQAQEYGERARRAETLNQEHSADLASLRYLMLDCTSSRETKQNTTPFDINLMRSQLFYRAAQLHKLYPAWQQRLVR